MKYVLAVIVAFTFGLALAETRSVTVDLTSSTGRPVPVSIDLLTFRDLIGTEFPMDWSSIRVLVGGVEVPYQIDDVDLNGRISAGDELAFLATGPAEIQISDVPIGPVNYESAFVVEGEDPVVIRTDDGFTVEVPAHGLTRITGFGQVREVLADEIGILRFSGYPESTWWANQEFGPHEEYTTLEAGGMRHIRTEILPAGPARVTVVSEYASERFVGLTQRMVARVYASGDIDVSNVVTFRGYSDMMKLQHMVTRVASQADPDTMHLLPVFRRLTWADQLGITPEAYFAERNAVVTVDGTPFLAFRADNNLSPLFWGATYIFASAEPWRAGFAPNLGVAVAELAKETPAIPEDYDAFLSGNTWVFESQEFRTGVFKWTADEFAAYDATRNVTPSTPNHYLPGDVVTFNYTYSVIPADSVEAAIAWVVARQAEIASVTFR
ncbi:MAG: hypothetical protein KGZ60_11355 [Truepera sp.]|nr:hypothetical protein [Truepera sp.]